MLFAFRLCLALGYPHPDYLLKQLNARQLGEWMAFYEIDPFGDQRADLRAGIVAAITNNRLRGKNEQPLAPHEFMPYFRKPQQTPEEIKQVLRSVLDQFNGPSRTNQHRLSGEHGEAPRAT